MNDHNPRDKMMDRPANYDDILDMAKKLSYEISFLRVDIFCIHERIVVGELTFFPTGGFMKFNDRVWDEKLGELEKLPINQ